MSATAVTAARSPATLADEASKLWAFLRRDMLTAWSYRLSFVSEWFSLTLQAIMFYFVGRLVDPSVLPDYGGTRAGYLEFAAVGIAIATFMQLALARVAAGIRGEQMMGTLESLLVTPTSAVTIQVGTVFYDLLYVPIRTAAFLTLTSVAFGLDYRASGLLPALLVLVVFIPFVWGLGVANAGLILTFRRGSGIAGFGATILTLLSGAFFPLSLLPGWARGAAEMNPVAHAVEAMRDALIGGTGWGDAAAAAGQLAPLAVVSLVVGLAVFKAALRRERRRGSLGLY